MFTGVKHNYIYIL